MNENVDGFFVGFDDETGEVEMIDLFEGEVIESRGIVDNYVPGTEMNEEQAREITSSIRAAGTALYVLIARAHEGKAYKALGYTTFEAYVKEEFDISRNRAYQLLDQSKIVEAIEAVTPDGTQIKLTEAQARDIKRELPKITERLEEETSGKDPEEAANLVDEIITEERTKIKEEKASKNEKFEAYDSGDNESNGKSRDSNGGMDNVNSFDPDDFGGIEAKVNNVDDALTSSSKDEEEEDFGYKGKAQERPTIVEPKDLHRFMDFLDIIDRLPTVSNFINSLSPTQFKALSQKSLAASDFLNELLDELAIQEMSK